MNDNQETTVKVTKMQSTKLALASSEMHDTLISANSFIAGLQEIISQLEQSTTGFGSNLSLPSDISSAISELENIQKDLKELNILRRLEKIGTYLDIFTDNTETQE